MVTNKVQQNPVFRSGELRGRPARRNQQVLVRMENKPGKRYGLEQPGFGSDGRRGGPLRQLNDLLYRLIEQHDVDRRLHAFRGPARQYSRISGSSAVQTTTMGVALRRRTLRIAPIPCSRESLRSSTTTSGWCSRRTLKNCASTSGQLTGSPQAPVAPRIDKSSRATTIVDAPIASCLMQWPRQSADSLKVPFVH